MTAGHKSCDALGVAFTATLCVASRQCERVATTRVSSNEGGDSLAHLRRVSGPPATTRVRVDSLCPCRVSAPPFLPSARRSDYPSLWTNLPLPTGVWLGAEKAIVLPQGRSCGDGLSQLDITEVSWRDPKASDHAIDARS